MKRILAKILQLTNVDFTLNFLSKGKTCQHHVEKEPYLFKYFDDMIRKFAKFRQNMGICEYIKYLGVAVTTTACELTL
jgi:hypothetical protein